jgi:gamma-glutamyltranspeptidase/glutathione hydrolase
MGGDSQPQILLQVLARWLGADASPGRAVGAPRWTLGQRGGRGFDTWDDGATLEVRVEGDAPVAWGPGLERRGHLLAATGVLDLSMGHAHLIELHADGTKAGAADPRALGGAAQGY